MIGNEYGECPTAVFAEPSRRIAAESGHDLFEIAEARGWFGERVGGADRPAQPAWPRAIDGTDRGDSLLEDLRWPDAIGARGFGRKQARGSLESLSISEYTDRRSSTMRNRETETSGTRSRTQVVRRRRCGGSHGISVWPHHLRTPRLSPLGSDVLHPCGRLLLRPIAVATAAHNSPLHWVRRAVLTIASRSTRSVVNAQPTA